MKYKPSRTYELQPEEQKLTNEQNTVTTTLSTELRELKKLLDDGIISPSEFEAKKKEMLNQ